ncbi:MAG: hypothetical protein IKK33_06285 [Lachnospiraceae bacterium]|nr:hypothetical protein [Lachnospiraceae bacterium]
MNKEKSLNILTNVEIILVLTITLGIASINHYKPYYEKQKALSYQDVFDKYKKGMAVGYPPGDDVPVVKAIEDIMANEYFTIEVSKEDIVPTRTFLIKDFSESGDFHSKVAHKHVGSQVKERYGLGDGLLGDILYYTRQVIWNLSGISYGEWYAVTLDSGEKIYVLVDMNLLDIPAGKKIKLPIGVYRTHQSLQEEKVRIEFPGQSEMLGIQPENMVWYVDMVGKWEDIEVGDISPLKRAVLFFVVASVICCGLELYIKSKRKE